jgi:hypothetical protein
LSEDGGGGDEELGEMHFQDDKCTKSAFLEGKIERMIPMMLGTVWLW